MTKAQKKRPPRPAGNGSTQAVDRFLKSIGKTWKWLAGQLDITEQSVAEWRKRGCVPLDRVVAVVELTGIDGAALAPRMAEVMRRGWTPPAPTITLDRDEP